MTIVIDLDKRWKLIYKHNLQLINKRYSGNYNECYQHRCPQIEYDCLLCITFSGRFWRHKVLGQIILLKLV